MPYRHSGKLEFGRNAGVLFLWVMQLPPSDDVDVASLSRVFNDKTNAYKFYWLLAILDDLKENNRNTIPLSDLALRMVANVWYPLDYFKLSFGKQDGFKPIADFVSSRMLIDHSKNSPPLFDQLKAKLPREDLSRVQKMVDTRIRYVPYRFLRPFLSEETRVEDKGDNVKTAIIQASNNLFLSKPDKAVYRLYEEQIELTEIWVAYLQKHQAILRGFTYWHLLLFLQRNNPTVAGLPDKLFKRSGRDFKIATPFWNEYLQANPTMTCIYSGQLITIQNFTLDHFIPWSYVVHDQVWNIIPTPKSVNSAKNNWLPSIDLYFNEYARQQFDGFHFHADRGHNKLLEDYSVLFGQSLTTIQQQPFEWFRERLERTVLQQIQTAQNLGFPYPFIYRKS